MKRNYHLFIIPALAVIVLDQVTKFLVLKNIQIYESIPVIRGFFDLVHIRNRGMAFGFMNRPDGDLSYYLLIAATLGAVLLLAIWFTRLSGEEKSLVFGISLILGGALGNLIDRLILHEVIDFLDIYVGQYHWPAFNVADSAITVGVIWLAIDMLFRRPKKA